MWLQLAEATGDGLSGWYALLAPVFLAIGTAIPTMAKKWKPAAKGIDEVKEGQVLEVARDHAILEGLNVIRKALKESVLPKIKEINDKVATLDSSAVAKQVETLTVYMRQMEGESVAAMSQILEQLKVEGEHQAKRTALLKGVASQVEGLAKRADQEDVRRLQEENARLRERLRE